MTSHPHFSPFFYRKKKHPKTCLYSLTHPSASPGGPAVNLCPSSPLLVKVAKLSRQLWLVWSATLDTADDSPLKVSPLALLPPACELWEKQNICHLVHCSIFTPTGGQCYLVTELMKRLLVIPQYPRSPSSTVLIEVLLNTYIAAQIKTIFPSLPGW